jgi:hypothetical protein
MHQKPLPWKKKALNFIKFTPGIFESAIIDKSV